MMVLFGLIWVIHIQAAEELQPLIKLCAVIKIMELLDQNQAKELNQKI